MPLDITMTLLSIILMGGLVLFPDDRIHQVLGMILLALWICHTVLNHRWFSSLFRGNYPPYRIMQIVVNTGISAMALLLMISGIMLAWFLPFDVGKGLGFARITHLLASHWYYLFMGAHLGLHASMIFSKILKGHKMPLLPRIFISLIALYGLYAFIVRGLWKYMFLRQQFFFFDFGRGYLFFVLDYISILVLTALLSHLLARFLARKK